MRHSGTAIACAIALAWSSAAIGDGGRTYGVVTVRATVQPSAIFKSDFRLQAITISSLDIARGYVDLPASSMLSVNAGNISPIIVVEFTPIEGTFKSVEIRTDNGNVAVRRPSQAIAAAGGQTGPTSNTDVVAVESATAKRAPAANSGKETRLSYRMNLVEGARPGTYSIPLALDITL